MAQMTLVTGVPGDGKSLLAITKGLAYVAEGRTVYAEGFKELDYQACGFKPLPTAFESYDGANRDDKNRVMPDWMLLANSVIIYDECYDVLPARSAGKAVPLHIEAMARHRHYNIDFIFVSQKHDQLDSWIRGLVKEHIHVRRKFGFNGAVLKTWDGFQLDTKKSGDSAPLWKYPKQNFALYKSATAHTIKKKLPWFVWAPIPLVAVIVGLVWYAAHSFGSKTSTPAVTGASAPGAAGVGARGGDQDANQALRRADYAKWIAPRVTAQPWTAPAWDQLQPQGVPELFCIAVEDGRCHCITEQGTNYNTKLDICRVIAKEGVYNPFRKAPREVNHELGRSERSRKEAPGTIPDSADIGTVTKYRPGGIPQNYQPPEITMATGGGAP